jgi:hypothetical protein
MIRGFSLRRYASSENSERTAFFWQHKILYAVSKILKNDKVDVIVEADVTFLESYKGRRLISGKRRGRKARKRVGTAVKRGISEEQICVICGLDRVGNNLSGSTGKSQLKQT